MQIFHICGEGVGAKGEVLGEGGDMEEGWSIKAIIL